MVEVIMKLSGFNLFIEEIVQKSDWINCDKICMQKSVHITVFTLRLWLFDRNFGTNGFLNTVVYVPSLFDQFPYSMFVKLSPFIFYTYDAEWFLLLDQHLIYNLEETEVSVKIFSSNYRLL
jgi:hypothetical protein